MKIRPACSEDAISLADLLRSIEWFDRIQYQSPEETVVQVQRHLALNLADDSHSTFVAEDENGGIIGYIAVHWIPFMFLPGPEGYISELFIREQFRGKGIGKALLEEVKQEARKKGCFRLSLLNGRDRASYKRRFYEKQGWNEREYMASFVFQLEE